MADMLTEIFGVWAEHMDRESATLSCNSNDIACQLNGQVIQFAIITLAKSVIALDCEIR